MFLLTKTFETNPIFESYHTIEYTYDKFGNLLKSNYDWYEYQIAGNAISQIISRSEDATMFYDFKSNEKGLITSLTQRMERPPPEPDVEFFILERKYKLKYNSVGNCIEIINTISELPEPFATRTNKNEKKIVLIYDNNNLLSEEIEYKWDKIWVETSRYIYSYLPNSEIREIISYYYGEKSYKSTFIHTANSHKEFCFEWDGKEWIKRSNMPCQNIYVYNTDKKVIEWSPVYWYKYENELRDSGSNTYVYNENGTIASIKTDPGLMTENEIIYTYKENGYPLIPDFDKSISLPNTNIKIVTTANSFFVLAPKGDHVNIKSLSGIYLISSKVIEIEGKNIFNWNFSHKNDHGDNMNDLMYQYEIAYDQEIKHRGYFICTKNVCGTGF